MADITTGQTTATVWDTAVRLHGGEVFLVHLGPQGQRVEYTYAQFRALIRRAARAFLAQGVSTGETVLLQIGNQPDMVIALFGLAEIGAVAVPVDLHATATELRHAYQACGARWAVVEAQRATAHLALSQEQQSALEAIFTVLGPSSAQYSAEQDVPIIDLAAASANQSDAPIGVPLTGDMLAELLYTSGTTAQPKGVMITHANLVFAGHYGVWQASLRAPDRVFSSMPACHSNFQLAALMPVLVAGARLIMASSYSAHGFWTQVRQERATVLQLIAMMVRTLLLQPPNQNDAHNWVRYAQYFMPISDCEKNQFEHRFNVILQNCYGSTESICWAVTDPPTGERRWPSVGRAGLGYEIKIFDSLGRSLPPGQIGEIRIRGTRGRSIMLGYYNDSEATNHALADGEWLRTNDEGYQDDEGWFYFVDRATNVIKRSGENISSTEVECVLTGHELIAEAAVVGVPDPIRDQAVKAFVRLAPGAHLDAEQIRQYCLQFLTPYKVPELIEFVDNFPRTGSMKIEKRLLK